MDYGKDFYAAVTWNDVPDGRRIAIGWMSNWNYAGAIPTSPWRSAMSVPRELGPADDRRAAAARPATRPRTALAARRALLPPAPPDDPAGQHRRFPSRGKTLEIKADLRLGSPPSGRAEGPHRQRRGDRDRLRRRRPASSTSTAPARAASDFSRDFPGVQRAPLTARHGKVRLRILVDWSSVEVFADRGQTVITDQIFPSATSDGIELFAEGGSATLDSLKIRPLRSSWATGHHNG